MDFEICWGVGISPGLELQISSSLQYAAVDMSADIFIAIFISFSLTS